MPCCSYDANAASRHFDGSTDDAFLLRRRQRRRFASGFADYDGGNAGIDLALTKHPKGRQIHGAAFIERSGNVGYVARQPDGGI